MKTVTETIDSKYKNEIIKVKDKKAVMLSLLITTLGVCALLVVEQYLVDKASPAYMFSMVAIYTLIFAGLVKFLFFSSKLQHTKTKSAITKYSLFFKKEELERVIYAIETQDAQLLALLGKEHSSGVRVDLCTNETGDFCACQVLDYIPHSYQAISPIYDINTACRSQLISHYNQMKSGQQ